MDNDETSDKQPKRQPKGQPERQSVGRPQERSQDMPDDLGQERERRTFDTSDSANSNTPSDQNGPKPAAYDIEGRPLYYAPPALASNQPQMVYAARPADPGKLEVPEDIARRHEDSCRRYPRLNLSEGEFIIFAIKRHPFGVFQIWATAIGLIAAFIGLLLAFLSSGTLASVGADGSTILPLIITVLGILFVLILAGAVVSSFIYNNNRFYLTNESVIQEIQTSIFGKREQTVSLGSIEDASYFQDGVLPSMFNFGRIRLSTVGDETTYRFNYVADPKKQIATLNNAVENFKNGRRAH